MNKTMAWVFAVATSALLVVGATVVLGDHSGGEPRHASSTQADTPAPKISQTAGMKADSKPPASPAAAATAAQVQQVLAGIMARIPQATTGPNGEARAQTPAEVEAELRMELAKIGLHL